MLLNTFLLFAQDQPKTGPGPFDSMLPMFMLLLVGFFLFVILPGKRREKKRQEELMSNLKKNAKVMTNAGIIGIVASTTDGDEITLKLEEGKVRILKTAIVKVFTSEDADKSAKDKDSKETVEKSTAIQTDKK